MVWQVVVNHILETTGLQSVFSKVYTNPSSFDNSGCLQLSPYHRQDWCSLSPANMCKGHILDEHCQKSDVNYDVIAYVGDGANDFCPTLRLRKTDIVFPRRRFPLDKHITRGRDKVAAVVRSWDTGLDIINVLREVLMNVKSSKWLQHEGMPKMVLWKGIGSLVHWCCQGFGLLKRGMQPWIL